MKWKGQKRMKSREPPIAGLRLIIPEVHEDARGWVYESYRRDQLAELGIAVDFPQDNHARSRRGTLRGLHYQEKPGQAKLVRVTLGEVVDVVVDLRMGSPTLGQHYKVVLSDRNRLQLFVPKGFAHGYLVTSELAEVQYKVSSYYDAEQERGIAWDDPDLGIEWGVCSPTLSERDRHLPSMKDYLRSMEGGMRRDA